MTKQEKIIVSAYTGVLMCDFDDLHEYIQKKFGRPVFTHELADKGIQKEVEEKSKEEFLEICNREEPERKNGKWIPCSDRLPEHWVMVLITTIYGDIEFGHYNEEEKTWEWLCESGTNYWGECAGVLAWMPLPEPYKERRTDGEQSD